MSKALATLATQPLIVAKVGLQSRPPPARQGKPFKTFLEVMSYIVEREGPLALFKGIAPQITKGILVQGFLMMTKERYVSSLEICFDCDQTDCLQDGNLFCRPFCLYSKGQRYTVTEGGNSRDESSQESPPEFSEITNPFLLFSAGNFFRLWLRGLPNPDFFLSRATKFINVVTDERYQDYLHFSVRFFGVQAWNSCTLHLPVYVTFSSVTTYIYSVHAGQLGDLSDRYNNISSFSKTYCFYKFSNGSSGLVAVSLCKYETSRSQLNLLNLAKNTQDFCELDIILIMIRKCMIDR